MRCSISRVRGVGGATSGSSSSSSSSSSSRATLPPPAPCWSLQQTHRSLHACRCSSSNLLPGGSSSSSSVPISRRLLLSHSAALSLLLGPSSSLGLSQLMFPGAASASGSGPITPRPDVQKALDAALAKFVVKGKAPVCLRLVFHDAGTFSREAGDGGMNASIQYELDRPESFGLKRGWRVILEIEKALVGGPAEGQVSRADLIALAGAAAVAVCGGPRIAVPIGRRDAGAADPEGRMPAETLSAAELKTSFNAKGFNTRELIALSGAHTIGSKGFGAPDVFDNAYYSSLLRRPWLDTKDPMASMIGLPSDHVLPDDAECLPIIQEFAADQAAFFSAFSDAYVKMTLMGAKWRA